jgi:hypothetical protein
MRAAARAAAQPSAAARDDKIVDFVFRHQVSPGNFSEMQAGFSFSLNAL